MPLKDLKHYIIQLAINYNRIYFKMQITFTEIGVHVVYKILTLNSPKQKRINIIHLNGSKS